METTSEKNVVPQGKEAALAIDASKEDAGATSTGPVAREEKTMGSVRGPRLPIHHESVHDHGGMGADSENDGVRLNGPLSMFGEEAPPPEPMEFSCGGKEPPTPGQKVDPEAVSDAIVEMLKTVYDPEIPVNIYELGLIYGIDVEPDGNVEIAMTLTAPACPVAGALVREVAEKAASVPLVLHSHVELVWEPAWTMERMNDEAKLSLGLL